MNCGVVRPVKNDIPSGQPPDPLTNVPQISRESTCTPDRAGHVIVITIKVKMERRTRYC